MTIIAIMKCQVDGKIYDVGDTMEFDGVVTPRIAHNFTMADGSPIVVDGKSASKKAKVPVDKEKDRVEGVLKSFSREQLMAKLDEFGLTYKPTTPGEKLARLYLTAIGEGD